MNTLPLGADPQQLLAMQPQQPITTLPAVNPTTDLPFVWGGGGQRLTPDDIARRRQIAEAQMQTGMDYSPVGSWTQGLARVAQGVVGGLDERRLDKASAANAAENQDMIAKLLANGGSGSGSLAVLASPYASEGTKSVASLLAKQAVKPPPNNDTANDYQFWLSTFGPEAADQWKRNQLDPIIPVKNADGSVSPLRRSDMYGATGAAPPGVTFTPIDDDPAAVTPTTAPPMLSGAATSTRISRADAARIRASLGPNGQSAFAQWLAAHNVTIGD